MSSHIWDIKNFSERTLFLAEATFRLAAGKGADYRKSCSFVAYVMESTRQKGGGRWGARQTPQEIKRYPMAEYLWAGAERSKFRFMKGKNAAHYLVAGERILSALAPTWGLEAGTPPEIVWDKLLESL